MATRMRSIGRIDRSRLTEEENGLLDAVLAGNAKAARAALAAGADADFRRRVADGDRRTVSSFDRASPPAYAGQEFAGISIDGTPGCTALHLAASRWDGRMCALLLEHGADVNMPDGYGGTPLHWVCAASEWKGRDKWLMRFGENCLDESLRCAGLEGDEAVLQTPKFLALMNERCDEYAEEYQEGFPRDAVQVLLEAGAKPDSVDWDGLTPAARALMAYKRRNSIALTRLLASGLDIDGIARAICKGMGDPLVHLAVRLRDSDAVCLLVDYGADVEVKDAAGSAPLLIAVDNGDFDSAYALACVAGASADVRDNHGQAPLHAAAARRDPRFLELLQDCGARADVCDERGITPLMMACGSDSGPLAAVYFLLDEFGADIGAKDNGGATALHYACMNRAPNGRGGRSGLPEKLVRELLKEGADPLARDDLGDAPAFWAAMANRVATLRILLKAGGKAALQGCGSSTPLHGAASLDCLDAARWLVDQGADPDVKNSKGERPVDVATGETRSFLQALMARRVADEALRSMAANSKPPFVSSWVRA